MTEPARLPPHDEDAEKAVLGSAMLSAEAAELVVRRLRAEDFFRREQHGTIFEAIATLQSRGVRPDAVTVKDELRRSGQLDSVGGSRAVYLQHLVEAVPTPASAAHYAGIVREHAERRRLIGRIADAQRRLLDEEERTGVVADLISAIRGTGELEAAEAMIREAFGPENVEEIGNGAGRLSVPAPALLELVGDEAVTWTIDGLLTAEAVAIFGGEPKSLKSWAALDCAVAVATGAPALHAFTPQAKGPVLIMQEESRSADYARRLRWLLRGHDLDPARDAGELHVASQVGMLLDEDEGRRRLVAEIEALRPALVVLDPLVRMHSADEDRAREMRGVYRFLRRLQAEQGTALIVVHHMAKLRTDGPAKRPGQRLRGTGDLHALLDSGLYFLSRPGVGTVAVEVEHREAPPPEPFTVRLEADEQAQRARLVVEAGTLADLATLEAAPDVEAALEANPDGLTKAELEAAVSKRAQVVRDALGRLEAAGRATAESGERRDRLGRPRTVTVWKRRSE